MKRPCIALLLDSGPRNWASQEETHFALCEKLIAQGIGPVLIYSGKVAENVFARMKESGAEIVAEARLEGNRRYGAVVASALREYQVDLIHLRYFDYGGIIPWLVRAVSSRPIIYTDAGGWMPRPRRTYSWKRGLTKVRVKVATRPIKRFVAISEFVRSRLIGYGIHADRIDVIYNGVNVQRFAPNPTLRSHWRRQHGIGPDDIVISTVCRLDPIKDIGTILRAFADLLKRGVPAHLFIAGTGTIESELRNLADQLGAAARVHWLGHMADPCPLFQSSDIFTLASVGEAFGFVLAEAMACGVACVGSRCGGITEVIADGRSGVLADPQSPSSFADAYERLARDAALRNAMGLEGRNRVDRLFSVEEATQKTIAVYRQFLK